MLLIIIFWLAPGLLGGFLQWRYLIGLNPGSKLTLSDVFLFFIWTLLGPVSLFASLIELYIVRPKSFPTLPNPENVVLWRRK